MGILDEPEMDRTASRQAQSRRSWPLSARLVVGALFVANIFLAAFLIRTEIAGFGARAISIPLKLQRQKAGSAPQLKTLPNKGGSLDQGSRLGPGLDQGSGIDLGRGDLKASSVEARLAGLPSAHMAKRADNRGLRASKEPREVLSAPISGAVIIPPPQPLARTPAPVPSPAASLNASANIPPRGRVPSFGIPDQGVHSRAGQHPNVPAASALGASLIGHALNAKRTRSGAVATVASVGLPTMEKGLVTAKRPVAPAGVKIEMIPRPAEEVENCGNDKVFVACPKLKIRYDTPYTFEAEP